MASKLIRDISASTIQVAVNQLAGLAVFLLTSLYLPKDIFGELNWSIALLTFTTTLLSLRLEQVLVKKAAALPDASKVMTLFLLHVLFSGVLFWLLLLILSLLFPAFFTVHHLLLMIGISQVISFFSSPFKQVANGRERFGFLAAMSAVSNIVRASGLAIMVLFFSLTTKAVLLVFIAGSVAELMLSWWLVSKRMNIRITRKVSFTDYRHLLKESLPQIGTALLMAGITRMDWILLGIFSTAAFTADYSFAYRVYELSPVPLLIIAPVLLSRFSKFFALHTENDLLKKKQSIGVFIRIEMLAATFIPLMINICWVPVLESLSNGKYGYSNALVFLVLSCCTPFQYISNLFWTSLFAQNKLKRILKVTLITFLIILAGDLVMIPLYGKTGAALVYLTAMIAEYINYMRASALSEIKETWLSLLICIAIAAVSGFTAISVTENFAMQLLIAAALYLVLALATCQMKKSDINIMLSMARGSRETQKNPGS